MRTVTRTLLAAFSLTTSLACSDATSIEEGTTALEAAPSDEPDHDHDRLADPLKGLSLIDAFDAELATDGSPSDDGPEAPLATSQTGVPPQDAGTVTDAGPSAATDGGVLTDAGKTPPPPPALPLLKAGLHPKASDGLRAIGIAAKQIMQTIGTAKASAGTHGKDGEVNGLSYSAATDLSVRSLNGTMKSDAEIRDLLKKLASVGYAAWYRRPGSDGWPASEAPHIHAIYVGCAMKLSLRRQMADFFVGKNGLASHKAYGFYTWAPTTIAALKTQYLKYNSP